MKIVPSIVPSMLVILIILSLATIPGCITGGTKPANAQVNGSSGVNGTEIVENATRLEYANFYVAVPEGTSRVLVKTSQRSIELTRISQIVFAGEVNGSGDYQVVAIGDDDEIGRVSGRLEGIVCTFVPEPGKGRRLMKGIYLGADANVSDFKAVRGIGASWVGIVFPALAGERIRDNVRRSTGLAHTNGLKAYLVPRASKVENVSQFFEAYKRAVQEYAKMAEEDKADILDLGQGLSSLVIEGYPQIDGINKTEAWKELISSVRKDYSGDLALSLPCQSRNYCLTERTSLWSILNYTGLVWEMPLNGSSVEQFEFSARTLMSDKLDPLYDRYGRPILVSLAPRDPDKLDAFFRAVNKDSYIQGVFLDNWSSLDPSLKAVASKWFHWYKD